MPFEPINPPQFPTPIAPYSAGAKAGNTVYVSGVLALGEGGAVLHVGDAAIEEDLRGRDVLRRGGRGQGQRSEEAEDMKRLAKPAGHGLRHQGDEGSRVERSGGTRRRKRASVLNPGRKWEPWG